MTDTRKRFRKTPLLGALAAATLTLGPIHADALVIQDNAISGSVTNTFDGLTAGIVDGLVFQTGASYGERLAGQTISSVGTFDVISGTPTTPLAVVAGNPSQNLQVLGGANKFLLGCGASGGGCPDAGAVGEGAVSVLLDQDSDVFGFSVLGADVGTGSLGISFYDGTGGSIGAFSIAATNGFFGFKTSSVAEAIRAVTITNTDFSGVVYDNVTFNQPAAPVPEPGTLLLLGTGIAGLAARRKRPIG